MKRKIRFVLTRQVFFWFVSSLFHSVVMLTELDSGVEKDLKGYVEYKSRSLSLELLYCRVVWSRVFLYSKISLSLRDLIRTNLHAWQ